MYGKKRPDLVKLNKSKEHIEKVRVKKLGTTLSEETKRKIGIASKESNLKLKWWQGEDNPTKIKNYDSKIDSRITLKKLRNTRFRLIQQLNYKCQECKKDFTKTPKLLHIHHIIPRRNGGNDDDSNLQILCYKCHHKIDYLIIKLEKEIDKKYNGSKKC